MLLKKAVTKGIIYLLFYSVDIHNPMVMKHWIPAVPPGPLPSYEMIPLYKW